jgi:hypothetical protein
MTLNPFFLQGSFGEQGLVQDLINEQLRMYGIEVYYIPRSYVNEKKIIEEVNISEFLYAFPLEAYLENYDGYNNTGTILSKFGVQELDDLTLTISKERYELAVKPLIQDKDNVKLTERPKEGDLIYFPLGDRLFEIKYVEHEKPFYQLQNRYTYQLTCELFAYNNEVIDTNLEFIDDNVQNEGYIQSLQMVGIGSTARAITTIANGGVRTVTILNRGSGYTSPPVVAFSSSPSPRGTAAGISSMISGIVDFCEPNKDLSRVQSVNIINPGFGYTIAPKINFIGGEGSGANATSNIGNGVIGIITVTSGGYGYINPPTISFVGVGTTVGHIQASAISNITTTGEISQILITNAGLGYLSTPTIIISPPESMTENGGYVLNEIIVGSSSSVTAKVKYWDPTNRILNVSDLSGLFVPTEYIVGQQSGASYKFKQINTDSQSGGGYAQNSEIQEEANSILDFSEKNPFGTP